MGSSLEFHFRRRSNACDLNKKAPFERLFLFFAFNLRGFGIRFFYDLISKTLGNLKHINLFYEALRLGVDVFGYFICILSVTGYRASRFSDIFHV